MSCQLLTTQMFYIEREREREREPKCMGFLLFFPQHSKSQTKKLFYSS